MNAPAPAADTTRAMREVHGLPEGQGKARVGGTDDGNADDDCGGDAILNGTVNALGIHDEGAIVSSMKEDKESPTAEDGPGSLKGWKLESVEEYARRIGKDVKVVRAEMLRDFQESMANKANTLPGGYQLPIVFRPPSPLDHTCESQMAAAIEWRAGI
ncbi:hypothetical protein GLOTRDRAFT_96518 [Gloeophyllum trabeum ATCC 11539]|uniref:Uncharacterized protein n=1 Tax=Gloeophyllum trabeum (strain ATCC 11539 / FP-39264 / Madison 617) TaxID=670483 RepID=S7PU84_GLOTA|nr:uncharacterized protein GLOTRDRAFT_96518 [Gloeophyllum trabeum ATCC 11539]EPQ51371.1 hypothetical protein GLOTRDRAFT_96518 [Gloeophyllum trabeum ATCC 11539]